MDLKGYNKIREKINEKDFEGKNKKLDRWLYGATFLGNIISIFFAFFLLFPALEGSFYAQINNDTISTIAAFTFSVGFLVVFEVIKRFLIRNFSFDYLWKNVKFVVTKTYVWLFLVLTIIGISFYLSLSGAQNFASTFDERIAEETVQIEGEIEGIREYYHDEHISYYEAQIRELNEIINDYRRRISNLPDDFITARREYQEIVRENQELISEYREIVAEYRNSMNEEIETIRMEYDETRERAEADDFSVILLFIIIVALNESLIVLGIYFREYFEREIYLLHKNTYDVHYTKKTKYLKLLKYLFANDYHKIGDPINYNSLKKLLLKKSNLRRPEHLLNKFFDDLVHMGALSEQDDDGNYYIKKSLEDIQENLNNLDDETFILENLKDL